MAQSTLFSWQRAKKLASDSPLLVDFAAGLVNSVLNLPDGQVKYFEEIFNLQKNCEINSANFEEFNLQKNCEINSAHQ